MRGVPVSPMAVPITQVTDLSVHSGSFSFLRNAL